MVGDSPKTGVAGRRDSDGRSLGDLERKGDEFQDWIACPACNEREEASTLAFKTDIVLECYGCGLISEFAFGEDVSLQNLAPDAIEECANE